MRLQRDSNPWPPRYRCDALPTELWSLHGSRSVASSIYTCYMRGWCEVYMIKIIWMHFHSYSLSAMHSYDLYHIHTKQNTIQNRSKRNMLGVRLLDILKIHSSLKPLATRTRNSMQVCKTRTSVRTCEGWSNGLASRLVSSGKSYKTVNFTYMQTSSDRLVSTCIG